MAKLAIHQTTHHRHAPYDPTHYPIIQIISEGPTPHQNQTPLDHVNESTTGTIDRI